MGQDYSSFKSIFDTLTTPLQTTIDRDLARYSPILNFLFKPVDTTKDGKPVMGIPTFSGRDIKPVINAMYPVTSANINQFNIQHGDVKLPKNGKNLIYGQIDAVDKGFTMGIYTSDLQTLAAAGAERNKQFLGIFCKLNVNNALVRLVACPSD